MQPVGIAPVAGPTAQMPFVQFEKRAVEKRKPVEEGGAVYYENVDFALVTPHGSKDRIEKVVSEWFARLEIEVKDSRLPQQWLTTFKAVYEAWKNDQEPPVVGTDIRSWPLLSPAECKRLIDLRCTSVETLAAANEEFIQRYGMGARALQQKAQAWLTAQKDHGPIVERVTALEAALEGMKSQVETWRQRALKAEGALQTAETRAFAGWTPVSQVPAPEVPDNTAALVADGVESAFSDAAGEE